MGKGTESKKRKDYLSNFKQFGMAQYMAHSRLFMNNYSKNDGVNGQMNECAGLQSVCRIR